MSAKRHVSSSASSYGTAQAEILVAVGTHTLLPGWLPLPSGAVRRARDARTGLGQLPGLGGDPGCQLGGALGGSRSGGGRGGVLRLDLQGADSPSERVLLVPGPVKTVAGLRCP